MTALLHVESLGKRFGGFTALQEIELEVQPGERLGLIGPNGSGKSTLVNCICGTLRNETGSVSFAGEGLDRLTAHERTRRGLARSFQLPRPFASMTVADNSTVLRLGQNVAEFKTSETNQREVVEAITAGELHHVPGMQEETIQ